MTVHNFDKNEMRQCIHTVYQSSDMKRERMNIDIIEDAKTRWLVTRIQYKLNIAYDKALVISQHNYEVQVKLWEIVVNKIFEDRVKNPRVFIQDMYDIVIPKDKQFRLTYQNSNRDEIIRFREELKKLHFNVTGKNNIMSGNVYRSLIDNML